jgi:hypothetical protein
MVRFVMVLSKRLSGAKRSIAVARFWMCHWQHRYWRDDINPEGPLWYAGSNNFRRRGVRSGDVVSIVSLADGHLLLGGRMTVKDIVPRAEAVRRVGNDHLYEAREWVIGDQATAIPLNLHRRLAASLSRQQCFIPPGLRRKRLVFDSETHLNVQTTRGIRELTPAAAESLEEILALLDSLPRSGPWFTVTEECLLHHEQGLDTDEAYRLPLQAARKVSRPRSPVAWVSRRQRKSRNNRKLRPGSVKCRLRAYVQSMQQRAASAARRSGTLR